MTKKSIDKVDTSTFNTSKEQHETLIGLLLGDAHLELAQNGKSARLKIEYSKKSEFYIEHLHKIFESLHPGPIRDALGEKKTNLAFSTKYSIPLLEYHQRFYSEKKGIPQDIGNDFTARSFAYLYMDDGGIKSKESKGVYINTYCFPKDQQEDFCEILQRKFQLEAKVVEDRGSPRIYISGNSYETLVALLEPYILSTFQYKIPPPRKERSRFKK